MDENRDLQMTRKTNMKEQNNKNEKEFVEYWKERMHQLVNI
jgi:hypothetical protein